MTQLACAKAKPERQLGVAFHKQLREEARSSTPNTSPRNGNAVGEFANKSAASAASLYGFVGEPPSAFRAVVRSVAPLQSPGGRASRDQAVIKPPRTDFFEGLPHRQVSHHPLGPPQGKCKPWHGVSLGVLLRPGC